jgi:cyclic pyranopterin phosphate synthase
VIGGILAAKAAGFAPIKLNAIALKGKTEDDIIPLARFARDQGLELRFIEYMPLDVAHAWDRSKVLLAEEILDRLAQGIGPLNPSPEQDLRAPAVDYDYEDGRGRVGLIASVSRPFCEGCNRLRLTADGKLRNCLFAVNETDLRPLFRQDRPDDQAIAEALRASVLGKWAGHEINAIGFIKPERLMHAIGG